MIKIDEGLKNTLYLIMRGIILSIFAVLIMFNEVDTWGLLILVIVSFCAVFLGASKKC